MPRQADLAALVSLIEQAYMVVSSDPMPPVARENLKAVLALAKLLEQESKSPVS
jgi:hypothetical protein